MSKTDTELARLNPVHYARTIFFNSVISCIDRDIMLHRLDEIEDLKIREVVRRLCRGYEQQVENFVQKGITP